MELCGTCSNSWKASQVRRYLHMAISTKYLGSYVLYVPARRLGIPTFQGCLGMPCIRIIVLCHKFTIINTYLPTLAKY